MKECPLCQKKSMMVGRFVKFRAAKYNPTVKKRKQPNLQWFTFPSKEELPRLGKKNLSSYANKRVKICTKCIKRLHKTDLDS
jgi:ribosomal protein L28